MTLRDTNFLCHPADASQPAMAEDLQQALVAGLERLTAWADLLDRINVFPLADGDTGRNLLISLAPLRHPHRDKQVLTRDLLISARGNSGNIASRFFQCLIRAASQADLPDAIRMGRDQAWLAVPDPEPGTMLTFLDALAEVLSEARALAGPDRIAEVLAYLECVVRETTDQQQKLREAGVVDAGALGLFLFFEGFLHVLAGGRLPFRSLTDTFQDRLHVSPSYGDNLETGYCVDTVIQSKAGVGDAGQILASIGKSVVVSRDDAFMKVHFHTADREDARRKLNDLGHVVDWAEDDLCQQTKIFHESHPDPVIHIMTDAAGSLTRQEAKHLGISLLDSYISVGVRCQPETYFNSEELYSAMRRGVRVTTSQASVFERHQIYASIMSRHGKVLYLCVGSAFTGNYGIVMDWKEKNDPENRLFVMDTGAASGRLGVMALAVGGYARGARSAGEIITFARQAAARSEEYVFLDCLAYLSAGGRISKTGAFFGDILKMKPIVSPLAEGARKVGVVRNRKEQVRFALNALERALKKDQSALIMLEHSDNLSWVKEVGADVARRYPAARIIIRPLSLTSGAHMGPGTWAVAFLPDIRP